MTRLQLECFLTGIIASLVAMPGLAAPPTLQVQDLLTAMHVSPKQVEAAKAGEIISGKTDASNEREIVATMVFLAN